jgi:rhamnogalacturonyl hydrolase YesR
VQSLIGVTRFNSGTFYESPCVPNRVAGSPRNRSDFVYMASPFTAYFGAYGQDDANKTYLLQAAYDQCRLYRQYLQDNSTKLWKHIELGSYQDNNLWATGDGWAVAGMPRVRQTISLSDVSGSFVNQQNDLLDWIEEIVKASWTYQVNTTIRGHLLLSL